MNPRYCDYMRCKNYKLKYENLCRVHKKMMDKNRTVYYNYFFVFNIALIFVCIYTSYTNRESLGKDFTVNFENVKNYGFDIGSKSFENVLLLKEFLIDNKFGCNGNVSCNELINNFSEIYNSFIDGFQYLEYNNIINVK